MRTKRCHGVRPQQAAASRTSAGIASKPRWIGWTTNGMLAMADASSSPSNENGSDWPDDGLERLAERRARAEGDEQVEAEHRRRQHERHGDERLDQQLAAELAERPAGGRARCRTAAGSRSCRRRATARRGEPSSPSAAIVALRSRASGESRARRRSAGRRRTASAIGPARFSSTMRWRSGGWSASGITA